MHIRSVFAQFLLAFSVLAAEAQTAPPTPQAPSSTAPKPSPDLVAGIRANYDEAKVGMHDGGHGMVPTDYDIYVQFLKAQFHL